MTAEHLGPNARPPSHLRARQIWLLLQRYGGQLVLLIGCLFALRAAWRHGRRRPAPPDDDKKSAHD